ncbi:MAG: hypothetical protein NVS1B7_1150 [Candidatus Saccharimonadales bacterium]
MDTQQPTPNPKATPPVQVMDVMAPDLSTDSTVQAEPQTPATTPSSTGQLPAASDAVPAAATDEHAETRMEKPKETPLAVPFGNKTPHQRRAPIGTIVVVLLVALALIGLTVFAYLKNTQSSNKPVVGQANRSVSVSSVDVAATSTDVAATLSKFNDTKDFSTADLSDATLGI